MLHAVLGSRKTSFFRGFYQGWQLPDRYGNLRAQGVANSLSREMRAQVVGAEKFRVAQRARYSGLLQLPVAVLQCGPVRIQALQEPALLIELNGEHSRQAQSLVGCSTCVQDRLPVDAILAQP